MEKMYQGTALIHWLLGIAYHSFVKIQCRNLAKAVGNYLIVQSMKDCRWKKRSSSVWGLSAQKNIELFRWMVGLNHDATLEVLVDLVVSPDKHEQLAGCMFIFELISIYALNLRNKSFTSTNDTAKEVPISICLQFFPHLISLAKKGSVISGRLTIVVDFSCTDTESFS
jgi:hypothetical protein